MNDKENMTDETSSGSETASAPSTDSSRPYEPPAGAAQAFAAAHAGAGLEVDPRPVIQWKDGHLPDIVDKAENALMTSSETAMYQRGAFVVRVVELPAMNLRNFKRRAGGLGIVTVEKAHLVEQLTRAARWEKFDGRTENWRRINAPEPVALTYLARRGHWKLPHLLGVISTPTLRPDGTMLQKPGYDAETATLFNPCGIKFPKVPNEPTMKQAQEALDVLVSAVDTIPFEGPSDLSVAIALMLTALVRRSLPSAPLGAITAPTPGSGKTLLADCISILVNGVAAPAMTFPSNDEEAQKTALTSLMTGDPVVLIDNIQRPLHGDWLCSILTSETYQGRALGRNEMVNVPTTTLWLATGNKLVIQGDLRTRSLLCRIDPKHERPEERKFNEDLKDVFARNRIELVTAGLTVMRAYLHGGERSSVFRPWGRFERWSQFCREPLMWLGLTDPCDSYALIAANDPERQEHAQMIAAWSRLFPSSSVTARSAITQAIERDDREMVDLLKDIAKERDGGGGISAKRLGKWLGQHEGRIVEGKKFIQDGKHNDAILWKVARE